MTSQAAQRKAAVVERAGEKRKERKLWQLMAQSSIMGRQEVMAMEKKEKKHEGSDESGKNIVFDNQTENVHSLSQNKANKMPTTTTATTQCGVAKGAEKAGKNTNTHARVCVLVCVCCGTFKQQDMRTIFGNLPPAAARVAAATQRRRCPGRAHN